MTLTYSEKIPFGEPPPNFDLPGIDGDRHSLAEYADKELLVVIFMCNHCPYVQACWERLVELDRRFSPRGVQLVGINPNDPEQYPEDSLDKMREYASRYGQTFPYLQDLTQEAAHAYNAVCTPDIFVYNKQAPLAGTQLDQHWGLAYHGRIDDNWQEPQKVSKHELADALDALLQGAPVAEQKPSMGCSIKWRS
ncbi:thioredoxin family protein [Candidatus Peregrinibacteria bacterium CG_4_9_14_0_2_um_filter_53_11]|nr:MAG: thioredoxin family protein [Candidatus Peregrinibacteria bacterium CG_4_9_14_0_2_um_filter_53_11]